MKPLRDIWLVFGRYFGLFIRNPAWVALGVLQPLLYLLLFAPLLKSIASAPGFPRGGAYNVFVPGLLIQLGMFGRRRPNRSKSADRSCSSESSSSSGPQPRSCQSISPLLGPSK